MSSLESTAKAQLGLGGSQAEVTGWFQQQLLAALADPMFNVPKAFETWVVDRVAMSGLNLGIGQIIGFNQFTANVAADVVAEESRSVVTYGALTTPGPSLTGIPDGKYLLIFGCTVRGSPTDGGLMALSVNGVAASDSQAALKQLGAGDISVMRLTAATLTSGNNTITAQYRAATGGVAATFLYRWLIALRYANP